MRITLTFPAATQWRHIATVCEAIAESIERRFGYTPNFTIRWENE